MTAPYHMRAAQSGRGDETMSHKKDAAHSEVIRYGTFGPIVWDLDTDLTRCATQDDMDTLPMGHDLTEEEEESIAE
jgi:hypothetical protein